MKNNIQTNPLLFKLVLLVSCFMMVILYNKSKAAIIPVPMHSSSNRVAVIFKQSINKQTLFVSIKSEESTMYDLFIFSPDGILIEEIPVGNHNPNTIQGLKKGYYLYECFDNDKRMKSGTIAIK